MAQFAQKYPVYFFALKAHPEQVCICSEKHPNQKFYMFSITTKIEQNDDHRQTACEIIVFYNCL